MGKFLSFFTKLIRQDRIDLIYGYSPEVQGNGRFNKFVREFSTYREVPERYRSIVLPRPYFQPMYYRLRRGEARLFCYSEDGITLQGYAWIQTGSAFRRHFGMLARNGALMGPDRTAPEHRGKGINGALHLHRLFVLNKEQPIFVAVAQSNIASQRSVLKSGYQGIGAYSITYWFWLVRVAKKLPAETYAEMLGLRGKYRSMPVKGPSVIGRK